MDHRNAQQPRTSRHSESSDETEWPMLFALGDEDEPSLLRHSLDAVKELDEPRPAIRKKCISVTDHRDVDRSAIIRRHRLIARWKDVARRARMLTDPWIGFNLLDLPTQECLRYHYSSIKKTWDTDTVHVKIHPESFARGAMRECYRLKKMPKYSKSSNWETAENYVAKKYIQEVDRDTVFEDVKLQMDSKLWAQEYNRHKPPKKIDIMQVTILEFINLPDKPLYHLEHFIEGDYIKYNSNSGFVTDVNRKTPQAFSHFTFERSGHQMIVIDIQGVGDIYTDPQIHTADGCGYGSGNLGTKGMALFFHSHLCSDICNGLNLSAFELADGEKSLRTQSLPSDAFTIAIDRNDITVCRSFVLSKSESVMETLRRRTTSTNENWDDDDDDDDIDGDMGIIDHDDTDDSTMLPCIVDAPQPIADRPERKTGVKFSFTSVSSEEMNGSRNALNGSVNSSLSSSRATQDAEREAFWIEARKKSRPASLITEDMRRQLEAMQRHYYQNLQDPCEDENFVLGQIHLDMCRYHELGRFLRENEIDYDRCSAMFHLELAAQCGLIEALLTLAKISLGSTDHELLKDVNGPIDYQRGVEMMRRAAIRGDRSAMLFLAQCYESGQYINNDEKCWQTAAYWYSQAKDMDVDEEADEFECRPKYEILQKLANLYRHGGFRLDADLALAYDLYNEAAELAMEAMQGKLANKLYMLAEECSSAME